MRNIYPMKNRDPRKSRPRKIDHFSPMPGGYGMTIPEIHRCCADKARFHSRKTVRRAARDRGLGYYRCKFCGLWHLTSKSGGNTIYD